MPEFLSGSPDMFLGAAAGTSSIHLILIMTLLFAVGMARVGRKDP